MHAENIWALDISKDEEVLLSEMRKTTRYLIKKAIKEEVLIERVADLSALNKFWKVYDKTVQRENFTPFSKDFIKKEFESFNESSNAMFFLGHLKNSKQILAASLVLFNKNRAFYHQGASLHSRVPVAYLMQWEAILEAKKRGCRTYDFWGIAPTEDEKHPWHGLTLFKKGFNGFGVDYLPTQDFIFSKRYYATNLYEKVIKWKRAL
jgi:lipid II:glycine glycyltransferase (peptidoglycan interpeptide bridge formation enzyme)